jgi:hypothetical protein
MKEGIVVRKQGFGYTAPGYSDTNTRYVFPNHRMDDLIGGIPPAITGMHSDGRIGGLQRFYRTTPVSTGANW